jgi:gliding motility-associated protein GldM
MPNAAGEIIRREFTQRYNVIAPPVGATVAADLMNVLYAGFENPVSVSASGVPSNKITLTMTGGSLTAQGNGKYIARPEKVGETVTFNVTGVVNGRTQSMGAYSFKVRKLPDPTAYITVGTDHFRGGRLSKADILGAKSLGAAIDDGLLNIPFRVLGFEAVFFDRMGNAVVSVSQSANFTDAQKEFVRDLRRGQRFYLSRVRCIGPDGIERILPQPLEVIVN